MEEETTECRVVYYKDRRGKEPVKEYIDKLAAKNDKDSHINLIKIREYIRILSIHGLNAGEPYIKHISGDIWELRPVRNRFILLHHFIKKTRQTPKEEIETARRRLDDVRARGAEQKTERK